MIPFPSLSPLGPSGGECLPRLCSEELEEYDLISARKPPSRGSKVELVLALPDGVDGRPKRR